MFNKFTSNTYQTTNTERSFLSRLTFNSRFYFFARSCWIFAKIGTCAKKGKFDRNNQSFYSAQNFALLESCGAKFDISGLENLDEANGPFVIASNHMSSLETAVLNAIISPRLDFTFVIKNSLFNMPFFGRAMRAINAIGIDRTNPKDDFKIILKEGKKRLEQGISVLIFPESTRQDEFKAENFNSIAVKLAKHAGAKIIPLALKTDFLGKGLIFPDFGPIHAEKKVFFEFGKPLEINATNSREVQEQVVDFIAKKSIEWQDK